MSSLYKKIKTAGKYENKFFSYMTLQLQGEMFDPGQDTLYFVEWNLNKLPTFKCVGLSKSIIKLLFSIKSCKYISLTQFCI